MVTATGPRRSARLATRGPRRSDRLAARRSAQGLNNNTASIISQNASKSRSSRSRTYKSRISRSRKPKSRTSISRKIVVQSSTEGSVSSPKAQVFRLMDLPIELRRMVYQQALALDGTTVLRTCRQVRDEGSEFVYRSAYLRLPGRYQFLTAVEFENIQNIDITIDTDQLTSYERLYPAGWRYTFVTYPFVGSKTHCRQTCNITIDNFGHHSWIPLKHVERVLEVLAGFKGFRNLFFTTNWKIIPKSRRGPRLPMSQLGHSIPESRLEPRIVANWAKYRREAYGMAKARFAANYGPGVWHENAKPEQSYLKFHPRAFQMALAAGTAQSLS